MKLYVVLLTILTFPSFGQKITGTVEKIDKDQLQVKTLDGLVTFQVDEKTTVIKLKKLNELSLLAVGDEVRVNYYGEGTPTAVNVSVKVTISGVIVEGATNHVRVVPDAKADQESTDRTAEVFVFLDPATKFGTSRKQLTVGRRVHVVGWDAGCGVIDADKVAVYDTDVPLRPAPQPRR